MDGKRFCGYRNRIVENVCRALWDVEYHMDLSRRLAEPGERFVMRTTPTMPRFRMAPFLRLEKDAPGELETYRFSRSTRLHSMWIPGKPNTSASPNTPQYC